MDYQLLKVVNGLAGKNIVLDYFFIFLAVYLIFVIAAASVFLIAKLAPTKSNKIRLLLRLIFAASVSYGFNIIISNLYFRSRPFVANDVVQLINKSVTEKSFPSDHAALAFAFAATIYFVNRRMGAILLILAGLVAIGRVLVGVHFPFDVIGGAFVGLFFAWLAKKFC